MSFEIRRKDLLGRIGILHTKSGTIETPLLLPVVNPNSQIIHPQEIRDLYGFNALITNSYLIWRRYRLEKQVPTVKDLLNFNGIVQTDSGAYQILQYGDVEVQPNEIVKFQERLDSDIAVILDVPTGEEASKTRAKATVDETLKRADDALRVIARKDILWVGPIQGGTYTDLVSYSAREMAKRQFTIHALGSPTPVMEQYRFEVLVDMIMAAKKHLPPDRPLHLFGAGHPMVFALAVALGCDLFDSASYALFARNGRYMSTHGTAKIDELEYFPCNCPACHSNTPERVRKLLIPERERFLAAHNLHSCFQEIETVKQAIVDGRLWELVESRSRNHPSLQRAFQRLLKYSQQLEKETPVSKGKGPFVTTSDSLHRPEVIRHQDRLLKRYRPPERSVLLLLPETYLKPFQRYRKDFDLLAQTQWRNVHVCSYNLTYAIVPQELLDVYPLSQTVDALAPVSHARNHVLKRMIDYLSSTHYNRCFIVAGAPWQTALARSLKAKLRGRMRIKIIEANGSGVGDALSKLRKEIKAVSRRASTS